MESPIRDAEVKAYEDLGKDVNLALACENTFRAMGGYAPAEPVSGKPSRGIWTQKLRLRVQEYGPWVAANAALAATVPVQYLVLANGISWIVRGAGMLGPLKWPQNFEVGSAGWRVLRFANTLTFVGNGSYHGWTLTNWTGAPANQLYAVSDHGAQAQNWHEARTGRADGPAKWVKYTTQAAANTANLALLPVYSLSAGPLPGFPT